MDSGVGVRLKSNKKKVSLIDLDLVTTQLQHGE